MRISGKWKRKSEREEPAPHKRASHHSPQCAAEPAASPGPASAPAPTPAPAAAHTRDEKLSPPPGPPPASGDPPSEERARRSSSRHAQEAPPARRSCYQILLVDDHAVVRHGLRTLLASQPDIEVCGEAATGPQALELVRRERPDLMILDLTLPGMDGLEVMELVRQQSPTTEILVLTMHFSDELARAVLRAGARAYVLKSDADMDLLAAVDHVRHHQPFFTSQLAHAMAQNFLQSPTQSGPNGISLTPREVEVVTLLAEGKSNKEAASSLGVSSRTVESHRNHIMHKMEFVSFSDLVRFAVRENLVAP